MKRKRPIHRKKSTGVENEHLVQSKSIPDNQLIPTESPFIRAVRDSAGVVSAAGILILAAFALWNLLPGWIWTIEDEEKKYPETENNKAAR